jgi:hypothetical protein
VSLLAVASHPSIDISLSPPEYKIPLTDCGETMENPGVRWWNAQLSFTFEGGKKIMQNILTSHAD